MNYLRSLLQFRRLVLLVILLSAWEFASRYILDKTQATLLPPPSGVFIGAMELSASGGNTNLNSNSNRNLFFNVAGYRWLFQNNIRYLFLDLVELQAHRFHQKFVNLHRHLLPGHLFQPLRLDHHLD